MPLTPYMKGQMLAALGSSVWLSLHTVDTPTQASPNEVTGGTYARKQVSVGVFDGVSTRPLTGGTPLTSIDVPAGTLVKSVGIWDAATNGNLLASYNLTDENFANAGKADINVVSFSLPDLLATVDGQ